MLKARKSKAGIGDFNCQSILTESWGTPNRQQKKSAASILILLAIGLGSNAGARVYEEGDCFAITTACI